MLQGVLKKTGGEKKKGCLKRSEPPLSELMRKKLLVKNPRCFPPEILPLNRDPAKKKGFNWDHKGPFNPWNFGEPNGENRPSGTIKGKEVNFRVNPPFSLTYLPPGVYGKYPKWGVYLKMKTVPSLEKFGKKGFHKWGNQKSCVEIILLGRKR